MGLTGGFSNTTMNVQLMKVFSGIGRLVVTPEDMVFRDKMYQVPTLSEIYGGKNIIAIY